MIPQRPRCCRMIHFAVQTTSPLPLLIFEPDGTTKSPTSNPSTHNLGLSMSCFCFLLSNYLAILNMIIFTGSKVRVRTPNRQKKSPPSPRAGAGQENIETVHEPKLTQTASSPWGQGRRAMGGPRCP